MLEDSSGASVSVFQTVGVDSCGVSVGGQTQECRQRCVEDLSVLCVATDEVEGIVEDSELMRVYCSQRALFVSPSNDEMLFSGNCYCSCQGQSMDSINQHCSRTLRSIGGGTTLIYR